MPLLLWDAGSVEVLLRYYSLVILPISGIGISLGGGCGFLSMLGTGFVQAFGIALKIDDN